MPTDVIIETLWRNALAAGPAALVVAAICSWLRPRPATRHALWLGVLLVLIAPPMPSERLSAFGAEARAALVDAFTRPARPHETTPPLLPSPERRTLAHEARRPFAASTPSPFTPDIVPPHVQPRSEPRPSWGIAREESAAPVRRAASQPEPVASPATVGDPVEAAEPVSPLLTIAALARERLDTALGAMQWPAWREAIGHARDAAASVPRMPLALWLLGAGVAALTLTMRTVRSARLFAHASPAPEELQALVAQSAGALGLRRAPRVLMVENRVSPLVWCGRRPTLVIPSSLWGELDGAGRRAVVHHELAHLRRRDHWVRWAELVVGAVYWWHPVAWWAKRRLREESDLCCDVWVAALMPGARRSYAEALLRTRRWLNDGAQSPGLAMPATSPMTTRRFARRITMVMTSRMKPRASFAGLTLAGALVAATSVSSTSWACPPDESAPAPQARVEYSVQRDSKCSLSRADAQRHAESALRTAERARRHALRAPGAPESPEAPEAEDGVSTFEQFIREREENGDVDERLRELERRLNDASRRLERLLEGRGSKDRRGLLAPPAPNAYTPAPPIALLVGAEENERLERAYSLPSDRLEALTRLMVRDDVPILVRPGDEKITVIATPDQHMIFGAFVALLAPSDEQRPYRLSSEGKLEALTTLMSLPTVPTLVNPGDDSITVHGNQITHHIFGEFVRMIDPDAPAAKEGNHQRRAQNQARAPQGREAAREMERVKVQITALMREAERLREMGDTLRAQAQKMDEQSGLLESQADRHESQAERLHEQAESLTVQANDRDGGARYEMGVRAETMQAEADQLQRMAELLRQQAALVESQADALEEQADAFDDRAEELEDRAQTIGEDLEERLEDLEGQLEERAEISHQMLQEQASMYSQALTNWSETVAAMLRHHRESVESSARTHSEMLQASYAR